MIRNFRRFNVLEMTGLTLVLTPDFEVKIEEGHKRMRGGWGRREKGGRGLSGECQVNLLADLGQVQVNPAGVTDVILQRLT